MTRILAVQERQGYFVPLVTVKTAVLGVEREFTALVDSGADYTMVPASLLASYGVDVRNLPQIGWMIGANGTQVPMRRYSADLWFRNRRFATEVGVLPNLPRPIVGRGDFFQFFGVHFHWCVSPPAWCVIRVR